LGEKRVDAAIPRSGAQPARAHRRALLSPRPLDLIPERALLIRRPRLRDRVRSVHPHHSQRRVSCSTQAVLRRGTLGLYRHAFSDPQAQARKTYIYAPLSVALGAKWTHLSKRETKELNSAVVFSILGVPEYQARHEALPASEDVVGELKTIGDELLGVAQVNKHVLRGVSAEHVERLADTAPYEVSPVCAVLGGFLAQDMRKAIGGREPPMANFSHSTARSAAARCAVWV